MMVLFLNLGSRTSPITVQQQQLNPSYSSRTSSSRSTAADRLRKPSYNHLPSEMELINKLRREAAERGIIDGSTLSPEVYDDAESVHSDIIGGDDDHSTASERMRKRSSYLTRLDEDSALQGSGGIRSQPSHVTRRSISRELYNDPISPTSLTPSSRVSSSRPVTRRSVSRELLLGVEPTVGRATPTSALLNTSSARRSITDRSSRERSIGRDLEYEPTSSRLSSRRAESLTRGGGVSGYASPSRPTLASHGRSLTQNEFGRRTAGVSTKGSRSSGEDYGADDDYSKRSYGSSRFGSLEDRGRSDWRRVSVPERGKDFKSLPRKYNR